MSKLSISIVNYHCASDTIKATKSILEHTKGVDFTLFVVENGSEGAEYARLASLEDERLELIRSPENLGYGGGHNLAIFRSDAEYHAVVNPDIILNEDSLTALCDFLDGDPETVMVTPRLVFPTGETQYTPKGTPTPIVLIARQLGILKSVDDKYVMRDKAPDEVLEIEFCTGCFFVARMKELREVGGFSKIYFMYFEDADISRRMLAKGRLKYVPTTEVTHRWERKPRKNGFHFYLQLNSMFRYFFRWGLLPPKRKYKNRG